MATKHVRKLPKEVEAIGSKYGSTAAKIRALTKLGWKRVEIAATLNIRYQHVANVQSEPLKAVRELK